MLNESLLKISNKNTNKDYDMEMHYFISYLTKSKASKTLEADNPENSQITNFTFEQPSAPIISPKNALLKIISSQDQSQPSYSPLKISKIIENLKNKKK